MHQYLNHTLNDNNMQNHWFTKFGSCFSVQKCSLETLESYRTDAWTTTRRPGFVRLEATELLHHRQTDNPVASLRSMEESNNKTHLQWESNWTFDCTISLVLQWPDYFSRKLRRTVSYGTKVFKQQCKLDYNTMSAVFVSSSSFYLFFIRGKGGLKL